MTTVLDDIWSELRGMFQIYGNSAKLAGFVASAIVSYEYLSTKLFDKCKPIIDDQEKYQKDQISLVRQESKAIISEQGSKILSSSLCTKFEEELSKTGPPLSDIRVVLNDIKLELKEMIKEIDEKIEKANARLETTEMMISEAFSTLAYMKKNYKARRTKE
jgi:hypothetical protein